MAIYYGNVPLVVFYKYVFFAPIAAVYIPDSVNARVCAASTTKSIE